MASLKLPAIRMSKGKKFAAVVIVFALAISYFYGGNYAAKTTGSGTQPVGNNESPSLVQDTQTNPDNTQSQETSAPEEPSESAPNPPEGSGETSSAYAGDNTGDDAPASENDNQHSGEMVIDPKTGKDKYLTDPVPEGKPIPVEWQGTVIDEDVELKCTLSIECSTILDNMHIFNKDKLEVLPEDGIIYAAREVTFYKGETVFNVLLREVKQNEIHMEFSMFPIYNSNYIEGINNIYEFDCGELSGWMYKVNGWFPNYGCSRYLLQEGDVIEWVYTCDLGRDVGCEWLGDK